VSLFPDRLLWYPKQQPTHSFQPTNPNDNELVNASCQAAACMHLRPRDDMGVLSDGLSNSCILAVSGYTLNISTAAIAVAIVAFEQE